MKASKATHKVIVLLPHLSLLALTKLTLSQHPENYYAKTDCRAYQHTHQLTHTFLLPY